ncbi:MAG: imidazoleglycerol-phosphate dehydratase [Hyperthermus sp.]|nr:MAG: imidazoleglycerol-phosphate dehydratase [Hyperthermus sp.]
MPAAGTRPIRLRRETKETRVDILLDLWPQQRRVRVDTGIGFLDHMVETLAYYAGWHLEARVEETRRIDDHHVAEDLMLALGNAIHTLLDQIGWSIARFGWAIIPMDEALVLASIDASGRPGAWINLGLTRETIGGLATENIPHMLSSLAASSHMTIHVEKIRGENNHHIAEAAFKATGIALNQALKPAKQPPSTKGTIKPKTTITGKPET